MAVNGRLGLPASPPRDILRKAGPEDGSAEPNRPSDTNGTLREWEGDDDDDDDDEDDEDEDEDDDEEDDDEEEEDVAEASLAMTRNSPSDYHTCC